MRMLKIWCLCEVSGLGRGWAAFGDCKVDMKDLDAFEIQLLGILGSLLLVQCSRNTFHPEFVESIFSGSETR